MSSNAERAGDLSLEPWMRGYLADLDPVVAAVLYALQQGREDLQRHVGPLSDEELWHSPGGIAPAGFHVRHIAGSVDRLLSYAEGRELTGQQLETLRAEQNRDLSVPEVMSRMEESLDRASAAIRSMDPARFAEVRHIGRKKIPTTLAGLLIHIAEHTQRHVGAAIATAKAARSAGNQ